MHCNREAAKEGAVEAAKIAAAVVITKAGTAAVGSFWKKLFGRFGKTEDVVAGKTLQGAEEEGEEAAVGGGGPFRPGFRSRVVPGSEPGASDYLFDNKKIGEVRGWAGGYEGNHLTLTGVNPADVGTVVREALGMGEGIVSIEGPVTDSFLTAIRDAGMSWSASAAPGATTIMGFFPFGR